MAKLTGFARKQRNTGFLLGCFAALLAGAALPDQYNPVEMVKSAIKRGAK
jgi:hypothetical protein